MSLNWDLTGIRDHEEFCWRKVTDPAEIANIRNNGTGWMGPAWYEDEETGEVRVMNHVTNGLIWMMMSLGCEGKITTKNVDLVVEQVAVWQFVNGAYFKKEGKPWYITEDDVRRHVGLSTNAFGKDNNKRGFKERMWKAACEEAGARMKRWGEGQREVLLQLGEAAED